MFVSSASPHSHAPMSYYLNHKVSSSRKRLGCEERPMPCYSKNLPFSARYEGLPFYLPDKKVDFDSTGPLPVQDSFLTRPATSPQMIPVAAPGMPSTSLIVLEEEETEPSSRVAQLPTRKAPKRTSEEAWDLMFERLIIYKQKHGHCSVPRNYKGDPKLAKWVMNQRVRRKSLSTRRMEKLESIDFAWRIIDKTPEQAWNDMYKRLLVYKALHGDCCVPVKYTVDPKLGRWVHMQRFNKSFLSQERKDQLDAIEFVWNYAKDSWYGMLARLIAYKKAHGDCNVPQDYEADPRLGLWVMDQQMRLEYIPNDRKKRLFALGFK